MAFEQAAGTASLTVKALFVLSLFACIVLHEIGHELMAAHLQIETRDVLLYPFGGISTVVGAPRPLSEFCTALAGPLVNLFLAVVLFPMVDASHGYTQRVGPLDEENLLALLFLWNLVLAFFNLIPALPLDGGRMLRAALAGFGFRHTTTLAARFGQLLGLGLGIASLYTLNPVLILVSAAIFTRAAGEQVHERARESATGHTVKEVMTDVEHLQILQHGMTVTQALRIALKSVQDIFPVMHGEEVLGIIDRQSLLQIGAIQEEESYLSGYVQRDFLRVTPDSLLTDVVDLFETSRDDLMLVMEGEALLGLLIEDKVLEFLLVHEFRRRTAEENALRDQGNEEV